jgi:hypothetical protein
VAVVRLALVVVFLLVLVVLVVVVMEDFKTRLLLITIQMVLQAHQIQEAEQVVQDFAQNQAVAVS